MCMTCGCGSGETRIEGDDPAHVHTHADGTTHSHAHGGHSHDHHHDHVHDHGALHYGTGAAGASAPGMTQARMVQIERDILSKNDLVARRNRAWLAARGIFALNLVSSPGAGKTTLLVRTIERLRERLALAVIEGDQQTSFDADRIRATGAPALQINTGKGCHLDAEMVSSALERLAPAAGSVLMIENVGNLVCPAGFDLGEAHKVVVLSVTEGEDKPLKYPDMFHAASLMLLNKADLLPHLRFDVERCMAYARRVNPALQIVQLSATTDEGMDAWLDWITKGAAAAKQSATATMRQRCAIRVRGAVQGVGFRPFVYRVAQEMGLAGWVLNDAEGVAIEAEGAADVLQHFMQRLRHEAPPRARVEAVESRPCMPLHADNGFAIRPSRGGVVKTGVAPDMATCDDCLAELFTPADRRHRYAFINCTQCGPRYTITRALPYDRAQTSMAAFVQCTRCAAEYVDPGHRRFHAEPNACPACGPALRLVDAQGLGIAGDAIAATLALLRAGAIVAIKGLGGFHLACDARQPAAVAALRQRKAREEKPFAVMAANAASAARWVKADANALALLAAPERPVLLLAIQAGAAAQLEGVAPGLDQLGLMLPSTPIQHLLFHEAAGRPAGTAWLNQAQDLLLVMTSANPGGEPIVIDNEQALQSLQGIADALLLHDRDIVARCDDSVLRLTAAGAPQFIRRARGWTPRPVRLPRAGPAVLATGAWLKNTVCLTRGDEAFLSPHIGDLDNAASCAALEDAVAHLCRVLDVRPEAVAHDLHPDFHAARFAAAYAQEHRLPVHAVQHHHAHIAAIAAEHGVTGPLLGLALDGVGLGSDGAAWGGELLRVDGGGFARLGHLRPIALPGGDIAAREPWRLAAAVLHALGRGDEIARRWAHRPAAPTVARMLDQGLRCPPSSGMGRWFDAAAALLGLREVQAYEGQAPMQLEALAGQYGGRIDDDEAADLMPVVDDVLDPLPLLARLADAPDKARGAALFHHALAVALARWLRQAAESGGLDTVALGGGCFLNARLSRLMVDRLAGLRVLQAGQAPPNDGGIALGQAWVAICREGET